ncbi:hypothetical protein JG688_00017470 [Phytophthora aleatoria]|uniref:Reverse transcriptase n=1 Tax=Phytophthora aleatoria TaxID=2496075 RepID=A0A8J5I328_9STRA|nr:hypothetical protein JG688_00017470 [Phytophthora aleatoria]
MSQESHPSVDDLPFSEILSRPTSISIIREVKGEIEVARSEDLPTIRPDPPPTCRLPDLDPTPDEDLGHTAAEDVGEGMTVVPDVPLTTEKVKMEDILLDPTSDTPEEVDRLRNGIWRLSTCLSERATHCHQLREESYVILMWVELGRSRRRYARSPPNSGRSCQIRSRDYLTPRSSDSLHPRGPHRS